MTKKLDRPEFEALIPRIASGEITRKEAAEIVHQQTGKSPSTFLVWLSQQKLDLPHGNAGPTSAKSHASTDPDKAAAYDQAVEAVMSNRMKGADAAAKFNVNYAYLMQLVYKKRKGNKAPAAGPAGPTTSAVVGSSELTEAHAYMEHLHQTNPDRYIRIAKLAEAGL